MLALKRNIGTDVLHKKHKGDCVMDRWEYKILNVLHKNLNEVERMVNQLGGEGWEVISFDMNIYKVYLKRRK